jgi:CheY-like chemotaxis protein
MRKTTATKTFKVLILDDNPDVRAHFAKQIWQIGGMPVAPPTESEYELTKISKSKLRILLRKERFAVILVDSELGLGLGTKRGEDGQAIADQLKGGKLGTLNNRTPLFSIFGDLRIKGARGSVYNNLTFDPVKSGIKDLEPFLR